MGVTYWCLKKRAQQGPELELRGPNPGHTNVSSGPPILTIPNTAASKGAPHIFWQEKGTRFLIRKNTVKSLRQYGIEH